MWQRSGRRETRKLKLLWLVLLAFPAVAQQMDTANGPNSVRTVSIFDEIQDPQERSLFKELWDTQDPQQGRQRAMDVCGTLPALCGAAGGLRTGGPRFGGAGRRSSGARLGQARSAAAAGESTLADDDCRSGGTPWPAPVGGESGRQALRYLERALPPAAISPDAWPQVRDGLRDSGGFRSRPLGRGARPL